MARNLVRLIWTGWSAPDLRRMSWSDRLAWFVGSGFGSGLSPLAPGTAGAGAAAAFHCALMFLIPAGADYALFVRLLVLAVLILVGTIVGVWATGRMATDANPDPDTAVWDEFVGMWITLVPTAWADWHLPDALLPPWWPLWFAALCFFVFRACDTIKPWPCRSLEDRHGGWGIMLDDVAAGLWSVALSILAYAAAICHF